MTLSSQGDALPDTIAEDFVVYAVYAPNTGASDVVTATSLASLATDKPTVLVLFTKGKFDRALGFESSYGSVLLSDMPGKYGAQAMTEVISGDVNPSGSLPFSYPGKNNLAYWDRQSDSIWEFGTGLSCNI